MRVRARHPFKALMRLSTAVELLSMKLSRNNHLPQITLRLRGRFRRRRAVSKVGQSTTCQLAREMQTGFDRLTL